MEKSVGSSWCRVSVKRIFIWGDHDFAILAQPRGHPGAPLADSRLISWTHSGPDGGRATFDGWHGSMKPEGRRRWTMPER